MAQKKVFKISQENKLVLDNYLAYRSSLKMANETINSDRFGIEKLGNFLNEINYKDADEKVLQDFFKTIDNLGTYNLLGMKVCCLYRWIFKVKRKERSPNMMAKIIPFLNNLSLITFPP